MRRDIQITNTTGISLSDDGASGGIQALPFHNRTLHRLLSSVQESGRVKMVIDVLDLGAEVLARAQHHGELEDLSEAVEKLDQEAKRIVIATTKNVDQSIERAVAGLTASLESNSGPLMPMLQKFDPTVEGNVIDIFRDLVASTAAKATKLAVEEIAESTQESMERLSRSLSLLEKVAAVEEARSSEAQRGTAKGIEHERDTESLLGELVSVTGDSLDDVSTITGLTGSKRGDKTITPRGGCTIVTEEKCTTRISESKMSALLDDAMANRGAELALLIVDDERKVPGNQPFHFIGDTKVIVVARRLPLRMVYALFRARSLELAQSKCSVDELAVTESLTKIRRQVHEIKQAVDRFRLLRTEHTKATRAIAQAGRYVDEAEAAILQGVAESMAVIESLIQEDEAAA